MKISRLLTRRIVILLACAIIFSMMAHISAAQTLENYEVDFHISYGKVVVQEEMIFDNPASGNLILELPDDAEGISLKADNTSKDMMEEDNRIDLLLNSTERVELSYITEELLGNSEFIVSMRMPYDTKNFRVSLLLPENAVLSKPLPEKSTAPSPAYPLPNQATTDGRRIKLIWQFSDLEKGEENSFFVRYEGEKTAGLTMTGLLIAAALAVIISYLIIRKRKVTAKETAETRREGSSKKGKDGADDGGGKEEDKEEDKKEDKKENKKEEGDEIHDTGGIPPQKPVETEKGSFEGHLKEDEEQVVNILKQREGRVEQGTLRIITGFSKAKLSGLLKELEDRKIVHKEKRGKKNLVFLKKQ
ncbi:MAG: hypothetical protein R6U32_04245 [Candidatus Woesearchaeota archaeon]